MKKNYNFLTKAALVLLTLLFVPLGMMGQTSGSATLTWSEQGLDNAASVDGVAYDLGNYFTVTCNKNSASTAPTYYSSGTAVRCYATKNTNNGNTIVVAKKSSVTENVFITKVEYNGTHNKKGTTSFAYSGNPSETTTTSASYDEGDQVTTASATLCETGGSTNGQFYCTSVTVEYVVVSADVPSISLSPASVDVPYTGGNGTLTLTTANLAADPQLDVMFYDMDGEWITWNFDNDGNVAYTVEENTATEARTGSLKVQGYDADQNLIYSNGVTFTQAAAPVVYTTIPEIFAAATSTATNVSVKFDGWVVTGVSTYNAYVTDGINGFVINASNHGFEVGNTLTSSAALACSLQLKNGYAQVTGITSATEGLTVGTGGSVDVANIAMANLAGVNTGALVSYENLTCSVDNNKYYLTDGTTTLQVYTSLYSDLASSLEDGKTYNITGVYQQYNTTKEILPRDENDIEEVIPTEPTVTVNPTAVDVDATEHDGTITVTCENMGENLDISVFFCEETDVTTPGNYDWIDAEIDNQNNVYYVIEANTATEARTAYMVVKVADADTKEVYNSNLITFTQEGFSAIRNFTFEQTSATDGTLTNEPEGVTAVFNNTYTNNKEQLTKDNSMTLTIKGMPANYKVTGITLTVKNNASKGNGTATVSIGKKEIGTFNVTGLGNTYGDQIVTITPSFATSDLIINIAATENSVYCKKFTIEYEIMDYVGVTIKEGFTATTFSCDKALDFSNVEGITANIITDENGKTEQVTMVPANTGLYIVGAEGDYEVPFLANESEADPVTGNKLIPTDGTTEFKSEESVTYYVFGKQNGKEAFYKVPTTSGYTPSANKAVLVVNAPASSAKEMIVIGGDVTGIESIENGTIVNDNYYTIDGKLVKGQPTQKGIYVVNGRKVVIK